METIKNSDGNYNNGDDNNDGNDIDATNINDNYVVIVTPVCIKCNSSMFIPQGNRVNLSLQISLLCLQKGVQ